MAPIAAVNSIKPTISTRKQRAEGPACILGIGTANPLNRFDQSTYPDFYFNITNSNHMTDLKDKFQRMCNNSGIKHRYMYLNEEKLKENPSLCAHWEKSLDVRQDMVIAEVPKLGKEAAMEAIKEWGQPKSKITHLVMCTTSGVDMPGADCALTKLLGLKPSVKRVMMYQQGCVGGATVLRVVKDMAENNKGARVLVVCSEITAVMFRGPSHTHVDGLVGQALFGDGAAAMVVGSDPMAGVEKAVFEIMWGGCSILPETSDAIYGPLREVGLILHLLRDVPGLISKHIGKILEDGMEEVFGQEKPSVNEIFWVVHPGGPAILDEVEEKVGLDPERMEASRAVLREYGNMWSPSVLFILNYMRRKSEKSKCGTTGEGYEWGVLFGFGPGLTLETIFLKSVEIPE